MLNVIIGGIGLVIGVIALSISSYNLWFYKKKYRTLFDENCRIKGENYELQMRLADYEVGGKDGEESNS